MHRRDNPRPIPIDPETLAYMRGEIEASIEAALRGKTYWAEVGVVRVAFPDILPRIPASLGNADVVVEARLGAFEKPAGFFVNGQATDVTSKLTRVELFFNPAVPPKEMLRNAKEGWLGAPIEAMLEHELRHVVQHRTTRGAAELNEAIADVEATLKRAALGPRPSDKDLDRYRAAWGTYINSPREFEARLGDIVSEVRKRAAALDARIASIQRGSPVARKAFPRGRQDLIEGALKDSPTWQQVHHVLTPENEQRVRRAVYQELAPRLEQADFPEERQENPRKPAYAPTGHEACLPPIVEHGLLRWGANTFGANDVIIWMDGGDDRIPRVRIAFRAPAARIEGVYRVGMLRNHNHWLDISLQKAMGLEVTTSGRDFDSDVGQRLDDGSAHFASVLDAVGEIAAHQLQACLGKEPNVNVVFLPNEGAILKPHYSAKRKAWLPPGEPPKTTTVEVEVEQAPDFLPRLAKVPGVDLCRFYPHIQGCGPDIVALDEPTGRPAWEVSGEIDQLRAEARKMGLDTPPEQADAVHRRLRDLERELEQAKAASGVYKGSAKKKATTRQSATFFAVHATIPSAGSAKLVADCGGWLFPSLAVGRIPSVTFGPLVLVASVELILQALKPYRTTRALPVNVYDTDTWTITARNFAEASKLLYDQLTGQHDESVYGQYGAMGMGGPHQWVLGAPTSLSSFGGDFEPSLITSTKALAGELRVRGKVWSSGTATEIVNKYAQTRHRYPYLEAKVNGMLLPSCFQLAVTASAWKDASRAYMKATGIKAPLIEVPDPPNKRTPPEWSIDNEDDAVLTWSRVVADAILDYARKHNLTRPYEIG